MASLVYRDDLVLLLFGQDQEMLRFAQDAAERAGCRVGGVAGFDEAIERLDRQAMLHGAVVLADQPSDALDRLLERLDSEAAHGRLRTVVVAPEALVDTVAAHGLHFGFDHLFDPGPDALRAAIATATAPAPSQLHDVSRRSGATVLQQLSEEAARIATVLASLSGDDRPNLSLASPAMEAPGDASVDAAFVRSIIRARRLRDQYFHGEMFADPAFDMLLDLYAARLEGHRVAVSSLCIAAAVPATTALRWIKALTDRGLFVRSADPQDGRRVYIELSDPSARAMDQYLANIQRLGLPVA